MEDFEVIQSLIFERWNIHTNGITYSDLTDLDALDEQGLLRYIMHSHSNFQVKSNGADNSKYFVEQAYRAKTEIMNWPKCWNVTYKGLTNKIPRLALNRYTRFDLIYTLMRDLICGIKNAHVWFYNIFYEG